MGTDFWLQKESVWGRKENIRGLGLADANYSIQDE